MADALTQAAQAAPDPEFEAFTAWFTALPEYEKINRQRAKDGWMARAALAAKPAPTTTAARDPFLAGISYPPEPAIDAAVAAERERIAAHFDSRDKGVGGFYDAHEPAEIIRAMSEVDGNAKLHRNEVDDMAEMHKPNLIERLRECLPTAADGPDHRVWCSVRGDDLREAVAELEVQREALTAAMDEVDRLRAEVAALRELA
jgi:hypothetical protein